ncbi:heme exporter protein CcmD [Marinobacter orientalis]|uniref:Heme exporter protein D n=1 Tax=Marinobacter orientalis TaxID=1928859 RepID=A0A7Y0WTG0_9GAMM|nr:heme exporter protein CcmD [Marinobacter orientalis]NMT64690.1 heme exporter protein CcmD [Marinobacter orientalis]TGX48275.1 heme exporter protein CcmD [Marinobacter orientalis]
MAFDSFGAFMIMEGHGPYVWTCYFVFFLLMGTVSLWSLRQRRAVIAQHRRAESPRVREKSPAGASFTRIEPSQD